MFGLEGGDCGLESTYLGGCRRDLVFVVFEAFGVMWVCAVH